MIAPREAGGSFVLATSSGSTGNDLAALHSAERKVGGLAGDANLLQPLRAVAFRNSIRNVDDGLWRLPDRAGRDQFVGRGVDRGHAVGIFQSNINPAAIARRPHAMRQLADR